MIERAKPGKLRLALNPGRARLGFALAAAGTALLATAAACRVPLRRILGDGPDMAAAVAAITVGVFMVVEGVSLFLRRCETVLNNRRRLWRQATGLPFFRDLTQGSLDQDVAAVRFVVRDSREEEGTGGPGRAAIDFEWTSHEPSSPVIETAWPCALRARWLRLGRDFSLPLVEETADGPRFVSPSETATPLRARRPGAAPASLPPLPPRSRIRLSLNDTGWTVRLPSPFAPRPGLFVLGALWAALMAGAFALSLRQPPNVSSPLLFHASLLVLAAAGVAVMAAATLPWLARLRLETGQGALRARLCLPGLWQSQKALACDEVTAVVLGQTPGRALTAVWVDTASDTLQLGERLGPDDKRWLAQALRGVVVAGRAECAPTPGGPHSTNP